MKDHLPDVRVLRFPFSVFGFLLLALFLIPYSLFPGSVLAQELGVGVAVRVNLLDKEAPDGSLVSWSAGGYRLTAQPYDPNLFGVVVDQPALSLEDQTLTGGRLVLSSGRARVRVSPSGGPIKEGDFITGSNKAGIGQRAERNGFVLGTALEDFPPPDGGSEGKIWVSLNPRSTIVGTSLKTNLFDVLKLGVAAPFEAPLNALRYLLATVFMIISFILGFVYFGRVVARGTEAFGRNPLAGNLIGLSIIFNLIMTVIIMSFGLGLAYLILQL